MAKPVGSLCNMHCGYCYYINKNAAERPMSDALLERFTRQYIAAHPGPVVPFTWHGGEPTLAGLDFYRRALALQKKYLPEGTTCWNNLQTNGLHFSDEWCDFLAANRFDVGLSIDGAAQIHDRCRKDTAGGETYDRVAANIKRLKAHGVRPDLLCTVTSWAAKEPLEVYRALRAFDTGWVQFIPIVVPSIAAAGQRDGAAAGAAAKEAAIAEGSAAKEAAAGSVTEESVMAE
ncbi:MAG: radical SAM protein, partial [Clostridiales bacterium]|nr:radical SAM protein [Clostridiales bacterium]